MSLCDSLVTMAVFASAPPEEGGILTFRAPDTPATPNPRHRALERLLVAATEADMAEHSLAKAKTSYQRTPTPASLQALLATAARTLEKELAFDELWEDVSREWFHEAPKPA